MPLYSVSNKGLDYFTPFGKTLQNTAKFIIISVPGHSLHTREVAGSKPAASICGEESSPNRTHLGLAVVWRLTRRLRPLA